MSDEIYAVVVEQKITIPGDERSRTNPGHGYPEYTKVDQIFKQFKSREEWEDWIKRNENRPMAKEKYIALICKPVTISTEIKINIK